MSDKDYKYNLCIYSLCRNQTGTTDDIVNHCETVEPSSAVSKPAMLAGKLLRDGVGALRVHTRLTDSMLTTRSRKAPTLEDFKRRIATQTAAPS